MALLSPRKTSYTKYRKGVIKGQKVSQLNYGSVGLRASEAGRLPARQLEAARRTLRRYLNREGQVWVRVFPDYPVTSKPSEVRMGKGKGSRDYWTCRLRKGDMRFEVNGVSKERAKGALRAAGKKVAVNTHTVERPEYL